MEWDENSPAGFVGMLPGKSCRRVFHYHLHFMKVKA